MESSPHLLAEATRLYQAGQLSEAERIGRQVVATEPQQASAWHLLARLEHQTGRSQLAMHSLQRAIELNPTSADAHYDLGVVLEAIGSTEEAIASYQRSLQLRPGNFGPLFNLGNLLLARRRLDEAITCYRQVIAIRPDFAPLVTNLGIALTAAGQSDEAVACLRRALELSPQTPRIHNNLGNALRAAGQIEEAIASYHRALELTPDYAEAHSNLAAALRDQGNPAEAARHGRRALELAPDYADAHGNLAVGLHELGDIDAAEHHFRRAVELNPGNPQTLFNWSMLKRLTGDFEQGWKLFECRWLTNQVQMRRFPQPRWTGQSLQGKTLLLWTEQGFGDVFLFVRYAALAKRLGARVLFQCPPAIVGLLATCRGIDQLIPDGDALPPFDFHAPEMSLPGVFGTTLETIPAEVPYLFADEQLVELWREKLRGIEGFRIGVNWQGRAWTNWHKQRDVPLERLAALAAIPGVRLISLHRRAADSAPLPSSIVDLGPDIDTTHGGFMDTAAIMMNLDLVLSSDTSIPNLAGALGVPVWVPLPFIPDWRWFLGRSDSPWYPTMRLFRQKRLGDWTTVFAEIEAALRETVNSRLGPQRT